jgi:hypothetical protein
MKQIEGITEKLEDITIKDSYRNREFITFNAKRNKRIIAYFFCSAICHQTYSLVNRDKNLIGWNYLEYVFSNLAKSDSELLDIEYINRKTKDELITEFQQLFPESNENSQCTLDNLCERIGLLKNIGQILQDKYNSQIEMLINKPEMKLLDNGKGLYELLNDFQAFKHPLKKKSTLFIKLLLQSGIIHILDEEKFEPLMDYHMQRLLLRTSCINVLDNRLEQTLKNKILLDSDKEIREKCVDAIKIISKLSGISNLDLDDIFWALGRSCCNNKIICRDRQCSKNPCTLHSIISLEKHDHCLFEGICIGSLNENYQKFWEPQVQTNYY